VLGRFALLHPIRYDQARRELLAFRAPRRSPQRRTNMAKKTKPKPAPKYGKGGKKGC
jgi:hypothetical protein